MRREASAVTHSLEALTEDAKALLVATADVAEEKVVQARKRLSAALEKGRGAIDYVQEKAVESAKATDGMIREHPYHAMGVAFGAGAVLGFLVTPCLSIGADLISIMHHQQSDVRTQKPSTYLVS